MTMQPARSSFLQAGVLYELPLIGLALLISGSVLGNLHAEYYLLCAVGLGAIIMPYFNHYRSTGPNRARLQTAVEELRDGGFVTGNMVTTPDYDLALAFEPGQNGNIAWISMEDIYIRKKTDIVRIELVTVNRTKPGGMPDITPTLRVIVDDVYEDFGQPLRWIARKKMKELRNFVAPTTVLAED